MNFYNPNPMPLPVSAAKAASVLGKKAKSVPKAISDQERERRRQHMEAINAKRKKT